MELMNMLVIGRKGGAMELMNMLITSQYLHNNGGNTGGDSSGGTTYTVQFINDGIVISSQNLAYGDAITKPINPEKKSTAQYHFNFLGWSLDGETVVDVSSVMGMGDLTYTAVYENELRYYTVRFLNGSTVLQEGLVAYGEIPVYAGAEPTKEDYLFEGWLPAITQVTENVDYVAQFKYAKSYARAILDGTISGDYTNNRVLRIGDSVLNAADNLTGIEFQSVTSVGSGSFSALPLNRVELPNVTEIGRDSFRLPRFSIANFPKLTTIGEGCFSDYNSKNGQLVEVYIPNATTIGQEAFLGNRLLKIVDISNAVSLPQGAFCDCPALEEVHLPAVPPPLGSGWYGTPFNYAKKDICVFYVPTGSLSAYQADSQWSSFTNKYSFVEEDR